MWDDRLFTSRREFLGRTVTFLSAASTLPVFLGVTARTLAQDKPLSGRKRNDERILVVVQLAGGNDGLNTIIPCAMDPYYRYRRQLAISAKDALPLTSGFGLHPAATGLKALFDDGKMAVIHGVGYPNPNRSHFTSMDIWHSADPNLRRHSGWIGRYFDSCCKGDDPAPEPIRGVALMQEAPLAMQGERFAPLAFSDASSLQWRAPRRDTRASDVFTRLNNIDGDFPATGGRLAQFLQRAALSAQLGADEIRRAASGRSAGRTRRGGGQLGPQLDMVANMITADLPTRIYYVSMGGFDTHSGQAGRHRQLMQQFGDAMQNFIERLDEDKLLDRVLVMCFSEFGRRVQENASGGTDHGEAAPMFLFGSNIRPGLHGEHPSLLNLHRGDLAFNVDFRRVYATIARDWLKVKPDGVLGAGFGPLRLIQTS